MQEGTLRSSWTIGGSVGEPATYSADIGDEEDLRSLLLDVRKLVMTNDDAHFPGISNLLELRLTDDELRDANRFNRESWKVQMGGGSIRMVVDGVVLTNLRAFDLYVNGSVFHNDESIEAAWMRLGPLQAAALAHVTAMVTECVAIAWAERNVVLAALSNGLVNLSEGPGAPTTTEQGRSETLQDP